MMLAVSSLAARSSGFAADEMIQRADVIVGALQLLRRLA
jgi:hypothetical protein